MKSTLTLFLILTFFAGFAQDSTQTTKADSALDVQQLQRMKLIAEADSARLADSLAQQELLNQIEQLRTSEKAEKERLQARLDSLAQVKVTRAAQALRKIDSLRASTKGVPVVFHSDTLFLIYSKLGPFGPSERVARIQEKLETLGDAPEFDLAKLKSFPGEDSYDIMYEDVIIMTVSEKDAFWLNQSQKYVADLHKQRVGQIIEKYRDDTGIYKTLLRIFMILLVIAILYVIVRVLNRTSSRLIMRIARSSDKYMKGIRVKSYEFLSPERELQLVVWMLNALKWAVIIFVLYIALPVIFSIFPSTEGVARTLIGYITNPIMSMLKSLVGFIPELIAIVVIIIATRYIVQFLKFLSGEVQSGKLVLPGFYPDWAMPTYNLLRILIYAFAFIVIFPYLPGSDSPVFQGVGVFFGLLISLGSSSAIGNIIAGLVITYMRPFKIGDRVKIGNVVGDVVEKTMLVTRIRTIKNEDISMPNAAILNGSTVNYSSSAKELGLILHTTVTIGYDVPWDKVHELLIDAALKCEHIQKEPKPFVLQTSLDDFYVSYQINAYTEHANLGAKIYSELHANIQDAFNSGGVEILSPHYRAARDGNMVTIPANYLSKDYVMPTFNVKIRKDG